MKKFSVVCCCLLLMVCQANSKEKTVVQQLEGVWSGTAKQDYKGTMIEWDIRVTISPGHYTIEYPSLKCGGELQLEKEVDDGLIFKEALSYGLEGCYNNGKTTLQTTKNNSLRYRWFFENGDRAAIGSLTRQQKMAAAI